MNMQGMLALLEVAKNINPRKMNMKAWFSHTAKNKKKHQHKGAPSLHWCGTSACLLGWALTDARFRKVSGCRLRNTSLLPNQFFPEACENEEEPMVVMGLLDYEDFLFGHGQSGEKRDVLRRIQQVMWQEGYPGVRKPKGSLY